MISIRNRAFPQGTGVAAAAAAECLSQTPSWRWAWLRCRVYLVWNLEETDEDSAKASVVVLCTLQPSDPHGRVWLGQRELVQIMKNSDPGRADPYSHARHRHFTVCIRHTYSNKKKPTTVRAGEREREQNILLAKLRRVGKPSCIHSLRLTIFRSSIALFPAGISTMGIGIWRKAVNQNGEWFCSFSDSHHAGCFMSPRYSRSSELSSVRGKQTGQAVKQSSRPSPCLGEETCK